MDGPTNPKWKICGTKQLWHHFLQSREKKKKTIDNLGQTLFRLRFENMIPNYETLQLTSANSFIGLRIVSSGGLLQIWTWTFGLNRKRGISLPIKRLSVFRGEFSTKERTIITDGVDIFVEPSYGEIFLTLDLISITQSSHLISLLRIYVSLSLLYP